MAYLVTFEACVWESDGESYDFEQRQRICETLEQAERFKAQVLAGLHRFSTDKGKPESATITTTHEKV